MATKRQPTEQSGILKQIEMFKKHPLAAKIGMCGGAILPFITAYLAHFEARQNPMLWAIVGGGLLVSAISVFEYAVLSFGGGRKAYFKAFGFVVLLEATMSFASLQIAWLPLLVLMAINGLAIAYALVSGKKIRK